MGQCCSAHAADGAGSKGEVTLDDVGGARGARAASLASADGFADCRSTLSAPYSADEDGFAANGGGTALTNRPSYAGGLYAEQLLSAGGLSDGEQEVCTLWEEGRVLAAERLAKELPEGSASTDKLRLALAAESHRARTAFDATRNKEGWKQVSDDKLKVFYKHSRGSKTHSFCFKAIIEGRPEHLMALCREADLTPTWNRYLRAACTLCSTGVSRSVQYYNQWVPWPFAHRDVVLHTHGVDALDELGVLVVMLRARGGGQPATQQLSQRGGRWAGAHGGGDEPGCVLPEDTAPVPKESKDCVSVDVHEGSCMVFEPLPQAKSADGATALPRTECTIEVHIDPYFPSVPKFIIDFVLRILAPYLYKQVVRVVRIFDEPEGEAYRQRVEDSPLTPLYDLVRTRHARHIARISDKAKA